MKKIQFYNNCDFIDLTKKQKHKNTLKKKKTFNCEREKDALCNLYTI